jgi:uncharacterized membrane protein YeaQ/YmgE (transglycosylase-associated protein family)
MALIGFLILGLIAGAIARLLVPGRDPLGWFGTMALGCVGALVGGFLARAIGDSDGVGLVGSVVGAVIVLLLWRAVAGDRVRERV